MVGTLVRGCRCATSWCDLDLNFDVAVVTLTYKILSGLYLMVSFDQALRCPRVNISCIHSITTIQTSKSTFGDIYTFICIDFDVIKCQNMQL